MVKFNIMKTHNWSILCIFILSVHCYSLSNFKTAKALGKDQDGKPEMMILTGISATTLSSPWSVLPEIHIRYPLSPATDKFELGNKIYFMGVPLMGAGIGLEADLKYQFFGNRNHSIAVDLEIGTIISTGKSANVSISPVFLYSINVLDWLNITIAPKLKYLFVNGSSILNIGGAISLDIGKNFGVIPEFGYYLNYDVIYGKINPSSGGFYFGLAARNISSF